jgi:hypothetical protein
MKIKRLRTLLIGVGVAVAILVTSIGVLAYDASGTVNLTRGGISKQVTTDVKGADGAWAIKMSGVDFEGLPAGVFGSNLIVTRMRAYDAETPASPVLNFRSWNYQDDRNQDYYGAYTDATGSLFRLYSNMDSTSENTSGYVTFQVTA